MTLHSLALLYIYNQNIKDKSTQTWDGKMNSHFYDDAISNAINHLSNFAATTASVCCYDDDEDVDVDIEKSKNM